MDGGGTAGVDYRAVFDCLPSGIALLTPDDLVYVKVNPAYARMAGRPREALVGRHIFDLFPGSPRDVQTSASRSLAASLRVVAETGEPDSMGLVRYDLEPPDRPGVFEERYWSVVNLPVLAPDGAVALIAHRVEEVTAFIRTGGRVGQHGRSPRELEGELYMRARELQEVNDRLRMAHAREREVALALQAAMLPDLRAPVGHRLAVRYQPAIGALNVCGDWYDVVNLSGDRIAVAVGDVVGHGLEAAGVMGQLRSALSAACRIAPGPAAALEIVGLYARSVSGAESTTAVSTYIDWATGTLAYSNAGHPPAALLHTDGTVQFLDQATDPPLAARPDHVPRPEAHLDFAPGSILVLYTDGMIERRSEDIDIGLGRLADSLTRHRALPPEPLADALLRDLIPAAGATDDTALVIISL